MIETFFKEKDVKKRIAELKKQGFERHGFCAWSETWVKGNESVIIIKG